MTGTSKPLDLRAEIARNRLRGQAPEARRESRVIWWAARRLLCRTHDGLFDAFKAVEDYVETYGWIRRAPKTVEK